MIKDSLSNAHRHDAEHPYFRTVFEILQSLNCGALQDGHIELDGNYVFIDIATVEGRNSTESPLESHKRYIDIQMPLSGTETFGVKELEHCNITRKPYDEQTDVALWSDTPDRFVDVAPGEFVVFFPSDAHAPCITASARHQKLVVKVSVALNTEKPTL